MVTTNDKQPAPTGNSCGQCAQYHIQIFNFSTKFQQLELELEKAQEQVAEIQQISDERARDLQRLMPLLKATQDENEDLKKKLSALAEQYTAKTGEKVFLEGKLKNVWSKSEICQKCRKRMNSDDEPLSPNKKCKLSDSPKEKTSKRGRKIKEIKDDDDSKIPEHILTPSTSENLSSVHNSDVSLSSTGFSPQNDSLVQQSNELTASIEENKESNGDLVFSTTQCLEILEDFGNKAVEPLLSPFHSFTEDMFDAILPSVSLYPTEFSISSCNLSKPGVKKEECGKPLCESLSQNHLKTELPEPKFLNNGSATCDIKSSRKNRLDNTNKIQSKVVSRKVLKQSKKFFSKNIFDYMENCCEVNSDVDATDSLNNISNVSDSLINGNSKMCNEDNFPVESEKLMNCSENPVTNVSKTNYQMDQKNINPIISDITKSSPVKNPQVGHLSENCTKLEFKPFKNEINCTVNGNTNKLKDRSHLDWSDLSEQDAIKNESVTESISPQKLYNLPNFTETLPKFECPNMNRGNSLCNVSVKNSNGNVNQLKSQKQNDGIRHRHSKLIDFVPATSSVFVNGAAEIDISSKSDVTSLNRPLTKNAQECESYESLKDVIKENFGAFQQHAPVSSSTETHLPAKLSTSKRKRKKKKSRKKSVSRNNAAPPGTESSSEHLITEALESLEFLKFDKTKLGIQNSCHQLQNALINPSSATNASEVSTLIVEHLKKSQKTPLVSFVRGDGDTSVLLPLTEHCILKALFVVHAKDREHLQFLITVFRSQLITNILVSQKLKLDALTALCRVFAASLKLDPRMGLQRQLECAWDLCLKLVVKQVKYFPFAAISILSIWPDQWENKDIENFDPVQQLLLKLMMVKEDNDNEISLYRWDICFKSIKMLFKVQTKKVKISDIRVRILQEIKKCMSGNDNVQYYLQALGLISQLNILPEELDEIVTSIEKLMNSPETTEDRVNSFRKFLENYFSDADSEKESEKP